MIGQSISILTIMLTPSILTSKNIRLSCSHKATVYTLSASDILPLLISLTAAFLANRSWQVSVEHYLSAPSPVVSDPILFILLITDLDTALAGKTIFKLFATDLKLYSSFQYSNLQYSS